MDQTHPSKSALSRRTLIRTTAAFAVTTLALPLLHATTPNPPIGISTACYNARRRRSSLDGSLKQFRNDIDLINHSHAIGASGVQISVRGWSPPFAKAVRQRVEATGMFLEGQISLPTGPSDTARFEHELTLARQAGITLFRTVMLGGRRYEQFQTLQSWEEFKERSWKSLLLARPLIEKHSAKLALENHKDWRADELIDILQRIQSDVIGATVDFGNSLSLLENPVQTIQALAPHALTTHLKDMAVQEYHEGFLLSEVPLGTGFLNLPRLIRILTQANPAIRLNLEMITRNPLKIPCLTKPYWTTLGNVRGSHLAETLALVKSSLPSKPLPTLTDITPDQQLHLEENNILQSLRCPLPTNPTPPPP